MTETQAERVDEEQYDGDQFEGEDFEGGIDGVAIVGMSARLPGAEDIDAYWRNLRDGVESIRAFSDGELLAAGVDAARLHDPNYVKARGTLDDVELFDASFFGFTPREAETMDPQHRLFLEEAWKALEHAGYDADTYPGAVGVYTGSNLTGYLLHNLAPNNDLVKRVGPLQIRIRNDKDFLATLVAYKLNLKGSAVNVQTACSSSLVGVSLACQSLLSYQSDMALAGGISVTVPNPSGYLYQEGVYAPDGHCRAFDAEARGTVLGDGVGVVVLKRLEDALEDGDTIHAVIRGFATNNDGSLKLDYTAPSVDGQAEVIGMAHALGEIDPETISYVEAHGTGTPLGDPIEIAALSQAFRASTEATGFCGIGSVKTNIGHLDAAAGVASLVKAVLALEHRQIPPTLHYKTPNPQLGLESSPFRVVSELEDWQPPADTPRRAGISSFGVGGTNAHVVVEEALEQPPSGPSRPWQLLTLSARSAQSLDQGAQRLADHLDTHAVALGDVSYTLSRGRKAFEHRRAVVVGDAADAVQVLRGEEPRRLAAGQASVGQDRKVAFMFSGIGDHYVGMGRELYDHEPVYRDAIDASAEILRPILGFDPREVLYPADGSGAAPKSAKGPDLKAMLGRGKASDAESGGPADRLNRTEVLHPVLFMVEYALAQQWLSWGVRPGALIGYSIGEYVAACVAGVFSLEDALALVAKRAKIIEAQPGGAMLAVSLPESDVEALLGEPAFGDLSMAAVNGPAFCVVAGPVETVEALATELDRREVVNRRLQARHAFHSRMLEAAMDEFQAAMEGVELSTPEIPFLSNVSGSWIADEEATDPGYWAAHLCRTVRFGDGVLELLRNDNALLEIGPGQNLGSIVLQSAEDATVAVASLPHAYDRQSAQAFLLHSLGRLWTAGVQPDWQAFFEGEERRRVPLPTYAFDRRRYWVEPVERTAPTPALSLEKLPDPGDWFYVPAWTQRKPLQIPNPADDVAKTWLLMAGTEIGADKGLAEALAKVLGRNGHRVLIATPGEGFAALGDDRFTVDPRLRGSYEALFGHLQDAECVPEHIVYLGGVETGPDALQDRSFYDVIALVQAWSTRGQGPEVQLTVVSSGAFEVTGEEALEPEKALLSGPCRVIPQEYPKIGCRQIDLPIPGGEGWTAFWAPRVASELLAVQLEVSQAEQRQTQDRYIKGKTLVALRGRRRWIREFERVPFAPETESEINRLRPGGVYVLTGGLGGIGLTLAMYLAETCQAKLVLVGRRDFPERDAWAHWTSEKGAEDPTSQTIRRLGILEEAGAEVLVLRGDVTRREEMEAVRAAALERFGAIHGVIHAAGQAPGGLIQLKEREVAEAVLAPKVDGTRIVDEVFGGPDLDILILCSSLTAITGTLGLVDHAAANAFLDAYAHQNVRLGGTHTVSVNWDTWLEVGQAAEAGVAARMEALMERDEVLMTTSNYPRWEYRRDEESEETFLCRLTADHWILTEHRFQGVGLLPGTAYLDMARRAAKQHTDSDRVTLANVVFSQPCRVATEQERLLRIRLIPQEEGHLFVIDSTVDQGGSQGWLEHARGRITWPAGQEVGARHDFESAAARCAPRELILDEDKELPLVEFGPRWNGLLQELRTAEDEGWARLELPEDFIADLDNFALHPALADGATGIARVLGEGIYLPLSYDEVAIHDRLLSSVQCHFRLSRPIDADTLVCDVVVGDLEGRTLLEVRGYALRHLDPDSLPAMGESPAAEDAKAGGFEPFAKVTAGRATQKSDTSSFGLLPREGAEVFGRLLGTSLDEPQLLVSVRDFAAALAEVERLTGERAAEHMALLQSGGEKDRVGAHAPYEAPRTELEATLVRLFQDMLGEARLGIHDNFFDLGGNSLVATQLITRVREELDVEIALRALFEAPTAADLAVVVVQEQASQVDDEDLSSALAELSNLSKEELLEQLAMEDALEGADV